MMAEVADAVRPQNANMSEGCTLKTTELPAAKDAPASKDEDTAKNVETTVILKKKDSNGVDSCEKPFSNSGHPQDLTVKINEETSSLESTINQIDNLIRTVDAIKSKPVNSRTSSIDSKKSDESTNKKSSHVKSKGNTRNNIADDQPQKSRKSRSTSKEATAAPTENGNRESQPMTVEAENATAFTKSPINLDELGMNDEEEEEELSEAHAKKRESKEDDEEESCGSESDRDRTEKVSKSKSTAKRRQSNSSNSNESASKRLCDEMQRSFARRNAMLSDYVQNATNSEDIQKHTDQLISEIQGLRQLAQAKELEWNNILHLKKIKEELLLRLVRRRQVLSFEKSHENNAVDMNAFPKGYATDRNDDISELSMRHLIPNHAMAMPVGFPGQLPPNFMSLQYPMHRPSMLPKHGMLMMGPKHQGLPPPMNGRNCFNSHMGRQGPVKDVKSIIADYRQRNPEVVPKRGRRMKSILNPHNLMNGPRLPAPNLDPKTSELGLLLTSLDAQSQGQPSGLSDMPALANGLSSFKDILVQFAAMQPSPPSALANGAPRGPPPPPPPPPYPEISLLPLEEPPQPPQHPQPSGSLLHGILSKPNAGGRESPKFTTFSPTLARLLTAPERAPPPTYLQSKNCGEITITPVEPGPSQMQQKEPEVVHLDVDDPDDLGDDANESDRPLVIDEGSSNSGPAPRCQGCHQKVSQFVCAGCTNQWYCSRECQITAWDEHSENCT